MNQTTISKETMSVFVNGNSIFDLPLDIPQGVKSLYWFDNKAGYINNMDGTQTQITAFPAWAQKCVDVYNQANVPPPNPFTVQEQAIQELYATDWTSIPDITDPAKSTPTLTNQAEFLQYRNQLRAIVLGTQTNDVQLPTKPKAQWST